VARNWIIEKDRGVREVSDLATIQVIVWGGLRWEHTLKCPKKQAVSVTTQHKICINSKEPSIALGDERKSRCWHVLCVKGNIQGL
jgi:hypothetical protein